MLEKVTNVAVLVMLLIAGIIMIPIGKKEFFSPQPPIGFRVGQTISTMPGLAAGKQTLVLGIRPGCEWCEKDMPIYQKLVTMPKIVDSVVALDVLIPPDEKSSPGYPQKIADWLRKREVPVSARITSSMKEFGFNGTPTILLVDSNHVISQIWKGSLNSDQEKELLDLLN
jgi:hypothetical protein